MPCGTPDEVWLTFVSTGVADPHNMHYGGDDRDQPLSKKPPVCWPHYLSWPCFFNDCRLIHMHCTMTGGILMMTSSNRNIFRVTDPLCGKFTGHQWIALTKASNDVFFELCLNKRLSKQSWGWWFETPLCPLWRHRNVARVASAWWLLMVWYVFGTRASADMLI